MRIKFRTVVLWGLLSALGVQGAEEVRVALASNLYFAMEDLKKEFTRRTGIEVLSVSGASGTLATQIRNGAPFDIFISADMTLPDSLHAWGFAVDTPRVYAYGKLVVWTLDDIELTKDLQFLTNPSVKKIAIADPAAAPYGVEALKALKKTGVHPKISSRLIYGQNIGQVNQYVMNRNAQVGFTAKSVVMAGELKSQGKWIEVDSTLYDPIAQGAVICKHGAETNLSNASHFYRFLYSGTARAILRNYGYLLP